MKFVVRLVVAGLFFFLCALVALLELVAGGRRKGGAR